MFHHVWSVLASASIQDRETNNLSLINIIEQLNVPSLPGRLPPLRLVSLLAHEGDSPKGDLAMTVTSIGPKGGTTTMLDSRFTPGATKRHRVIAILPPFSVSEPGDYWLEVAFSTADGWKESVRLPLEVVLAAPAPAPMVAREPKPAKPRAPKRGRERTSSK